MALKAIQEEAQYRFDRYMIMWMEMPLGTRLTLNMNQIKTQAFVPNVLGRLSSHSVGDLALKLWPQSIATKVISLDEEQRKGPELTLTVSFASSTATLLDVQFETNFRGKPIAFRGQVPLYVVEQWVEHLGTVRDLHELKRARSQSALYEVSSIAQRVYSEIKTCEPVPILDFVQHLTRDLFILDAQEKNPARSTFTLADIEQMEVPRFSGPILRPLFGNTTTRKTIVFTLRQKDQMVLF